MTTALDVITDAFNNISVNESEAPIEAVDAQLGLRELNRMMASLRVKVGWTPCSAVSSTLTVDSDVEDYIVKALAKRLAGHYEEPVSAQLAEDYREARSELFRRYVQLEPSQYHATLPAWSSRYGNYGYNADRNGLEYTRKVTSVSSNYTVLLADDLIEVDCTNGPVTLTFPPASTANGYGFEVVKVDQTSNQVILDGDGSELIFGDTTYRFNEYMRKVELVCDGTQYD